MVYFRKEDAAEQFTGQLFPCIIGLIRRGVFYRLPYEI
jgi:hypothetical protein